MRRLWIVLLLCTYGFSTSQAAFYLHYCCGELETIALEIPMSPTCMDHEHQENALSPDNACCQNNLLDTQEASSQHTFSSFADDLHVGFAADLPVNYLPDLTATEHNSHQKAPFIRLSIPGDTPPIFLRNCIFII